MKYDVQQVVGDTTGPSGLLKGLLETPVSDSILSILRLHLDKYRLLAQGIVERDKDLIIQAIALDLLTPSPKEAERIFDNFIKSSEKFLPIKFN